MAIPFGCIYSVDHRFNDRDICVRCGKPRCPALTKLRVKCALLKDECRYHNPTVKATWDAAHRQRWSG